MVMLKNLGSTIVYLAIYIFIFLVYLVLSFLGMFSKP